MRKAGIKRRGKRTAAWEAARAKLKQQFLAMGVTHCEFNYPHHCWHYEGLSFAHSRKRRFIKPGSPELFECALVCPVAHELLERLPESEMCEIIREIIKTRNQTFNANINSDSEQ